MPVLKCNGEQSIDNDTDYDLHIDDLVQDCSISSVLAINGDIAVLHYAIDM